ncbi:MAG: head-tail connector protein [Elusimicrobiaceae bacterium]|nr:head-tail connector protein [Elusimicrobiaceae bacterium]
MNIQTQKTAAYQKRYDALKQTRIPWMRTWKELATYLAPTRGIFESETPNNAKRIDHKTLLDSSASLAVGVLGAGLMSGLTSPSRSWFDVTLCPRGLKKLPGASAWLLEVKKALESAFAKSNLYCVLQTMYEEIAVFGTAAFLVEEDPQGGIFCRPFTAGEYVLDIDEKGRVNTFGREFFMTATQLQKHFEGARFSPQILQEIKQGNSASFHKVMHLILPNEQADEQCLDFTCFAYKSVYFLEDGTLLREGGYHEFPVVAVRWETKNTSESYGRGPGWKVLGDVKMLQKMQKTKLVALDKNTNPPVMVSAHVQGEVNLLPGGITRCNSLSEAAVKPAYQVQPDLTALEQTMQQVRDTIRSHFFADVFVMLSSQEVPNMTAAEVAERRQEKMLLLGPVFERLKTELLDPLVERTYFILLRQGMLPPAPEILNGLELHVDYTSTIAQAQRSAALEPLAQGLELAAQITQADPSVAWQVDYQKAFREGLESLGVDGILLKEEA